MGLIMKWRLIVLLLLTFGLGGCGTNPTVSSLTAATLAANGARDAATLAMLANGATAQLFECKDLTFEQAQQLLAAGHIYLDPERDTVACGILGTAQPVKQARSTSQVTTAAKPVIAKPTIPRSIPTVSTPSVKPSKQAKKAKSSRKATYSKRYRCSDISKKKARQLLAAGHTYLDRDRDGDPCEAKKRYSAKRATKSSKKGCTWVKPYTRSNGSRVRGHWRCRRR